MYVKQGWSGETGSGQWKKLDVQVDETDLQRVLGRISCRPQDVPTSVAFQLLDIEAETLLLLKMHADFGYRYDSAKMVERQGRKEELLSCLRQKHGVRTLE